MSGHLCGKRLMQFLFFVLAVWMISATAYAESDSPTNAPTSSQPVYVIPVHHTIESGLQSFLERSFAKAEETGAKLIVLDINTLGGRVDSAEGIGELINGSPVPTVAFIRGKAASAGSYIALNANKIVMQPGSSIGAAAVVDMSGKHVTDSKIVAHWASQMRSAAELNGRNPQIAEGMVDESIVVSMPELKRTKKAGQIISLTAQEALKVGYADHVAEDLSGVLSYMNADGYKVIPVEETFAEKMARVLTNPTVMTLLMLIGFAGIAIELFMPGFGVPGILGVAAFVLYFFGHFVAGFAGVEDIILFVAGIILMLIELVVPGFGIFGIAGIISLVCGIVLAAFDTESALVSLGIALGVALIIVAVMIKYFKHRGIWNRFILKEEQHNEQGYVSNSPKEHLLHQRGVTVTPLRPSGTAQISGAKVDVVTEGEFIAPNRPIIVILTEGARVVVREESEP